jgi:hypothetical protein
VQDYIGTKLALEFIDLGPQQVKNIAQPIKACRITDAIFTDSYPDYKFFATQLRTARRRFDEVAGQAVACACSVAGGVAWSLPSRSWIRPARIWRCTAMPIWFGRSLGHAT